MIDIKEMIEVYMEVNHMGIDDLFKKRDVRTEALQFYSEQEETESYYYELGIMSQAENFYENTSIIRSTF